MLSRAIVRAERAFSGIVADDAVFEWLQRGFSATLATRRRFERNLVRLLHGLNLPSHRDSDRLLERLDAIDRDLDDVVRRVESLARRTP